MPRRLDPGLLKEILGLVASPREAEEKAEDALVVEGIEPIERAALLGPELGDQRRIVLCAHLALGAGCHGASLSWGVAWRLT